MDGNKDEALKCLTIGKQALESGDRVRALKFVTKARRLDPSLAVDDLLSAINQDSADRSVPPSSGVTDEATSSSSSSKPSGQSNLRHRVSSNGPSSSSASDSVMYTEEQILIVRQIKKKKDYYEILGLERTCSVEDVKKAYRKLSLKVHPDKNKAPGAEEAFKAVSKAFQCLSGEESRKKYDLVGSDEPVYERRQTQGFNGFYDADIDADEIFRNFFFGGGMPPSTQFRGFSFNTNMGQRRGDNGSGGSNLRALIQLLPVLLILLLNFLPSSDPVYMLYRSYPYEYKIMTQKDVPFYVKSTKFEQDYPTNSPERLSLEGRIEREYFSILSQNCRLERQRRQWGLAHETPHCDMLQQFENVA